MAPAPTTPAAKDKGGPTANEAYVFYYVLKNMKSKPDVDWDGVATDAGFKNGEVAKVRFGQIKRKLGVDAGAGPKVAKPRGSPNKVTKPPVRRPKAAGEPAKGSKAAKAAADAAADAALSSLLPMDEDADATAVKAEDDHEILAYKEESPDFQIIDGFKQEEE